MGPLEDALGLTIKHKLTNMTLNISQPELIRKNDWSIYQWHEINYNLQ